MAEEAGSNFVNPLAALRVLETAIGALHDLLNEHDKRDGLVHGTFQEQLDRRFDQAVTHTNSEIAALDRLMAQRFGDSDRLVQSILTASQVAVNKAEVANEKRFDEIRDKFLTVNEFRGQLADQATHFMPRAESEVRFVTLQKAVDENTRYIDRSGGGAATGQRLFANIVSIVSVIVAAGALAALAALH